MSKKYPKKWMSEFLKIYYANLFIFCVDKKRILIIIDKIFLVFSGLNKYLAKNAKCRSYPQDIIIG